MATAISLGPFERFIDDYVELTVNVFNYSRTGRNAVRSDLRLFARFARERGHTRITGDSILEFVAHLRNDRNNGSGSINRKISSLRAYVRHLRFRQVDGAEGLPIESLQRAREPYSGPVQVPSPEEVRRLLDSIDRSCVLGIRDHLLFYLLYRLGLRLGEALAIDLEHIDLEKGTLEILGKGRRRRTLPLVDDLTALLQTWLVFRPRLWNAHRRNALFISKKGNRLSPRTAQETFQRIVAEAGPRSIHRLTPHTLRHAFASHAVDGDADLIVLKAILGHARMKSTLLYLHPSIHKLRSAVLDHPAAEVLELIAAQGLMPISIQPRRTTAA